MIEAIGIVAAMSTTIAFLPQTIKTIKTKDTHSLSLPMYSIFCFGVFLWLVYGLLISSFPIILANGIILILSSIILGYKIKYK